MLINPVERYYFNKAIEEGIVMAKLEIAHNMLCEDYSLEKVVRVTGLSEDEILDLK